MLSHLGKSAGGILKQSSTDKKAGQQEWRLEAFLAVQQLTGQRWPVWLS